MFDVHFAIEIKPLSKASIHNHPHSWIYEPSLYYTIAVYLYRKTINLNDKSEKSVITWAWWGDVYIYHVFCHRDFLWKYIKKRNDEIMSWFKSWKIYKIGFCAGVMRDLIHSLTKKKKYKNEKLVIEKLSNGFLYLFFFVSCLP